MERNHLSRRHFVKALGVGAAALSVSTPAVPASEKGRPLTVDPKLKYDLSPYLYMQFMEPLGTTDGSVAAAWDFKHDRWREDVIEVTRELSPTLMRWGGCFASYYRWKEAVGPRDKRRPSLNLLWGGIENNQVGTVEFVNFCRQVEADPLMCVNFESDGRKPWTRSPKGDIRSAGPEEAAEWVSYCNNPEDRLRREHGLEKPPRIGMWQIGNETSYARDAFDCETAAKKTINFAKAMRKVDPSIELIGWGDSGWAPKMAEMAGEHLQYVAFHHMFNPDRGMKNSPLRGVDYRKDPAFTWERLMRAHEVHEAKIRRVRDQMKGYDIPLALTECHFSLPGRNRCEVLSTWAAGVSNARLLNVHERHGDVLKIATLADFCGTRWQVNAIMIPVPGGRSFRMPVALVMTLYRKHTGKKAVEVVAAPADLDVTASRTDQRVFLHVVNTNRTRSVSADLAVRGLQIRKGRVFTLSADPEAEVIQTDPDVVKLSTKDLASNASWTFPAASVSAVEMEVAKV